MRSSTKAIRYRYGLSQWHNGHVHYAYSYHRLFLNNLIFSGQKARAFRWLCEIKYQLKLQEKFDPYLLVFIALSKIAPGVTLFPIKKSGVVQGAPFPISRRKQITFALKWVIKLLKDSNRVVTVPKIVDLLLDAIRDKGGAIDKKIYVQERAVVNKHLVKFYR